MEQFDIRAFCLRLIKNWYWFIIAGIFCTAVAVLRYISTNTRYKVNATLMIRSSSEESPMPQAEMLSMMGFGGAKLVDDEIAILTSRDILIQTIKELDLQTEYMKRHLRRWEPQYPVHHLTVTYPESMTDTIKRTIHIDLKVRRNSYIVKLKYDNFFPKRYKVSSLDDPIETFLGPIKITANVPLEKGSRYLIRTAPLLPLAARYAKNIKATKLKTDSYVIHISTLSDHPKRDIDFINKQIDLYNLDAVIDKNIMATNTAHFIEDRLRLIEKELSDAEQQVEQYKHENQLLSPQTEAQTWFMETNAYRKQLADLHTQLNLIQYVEDFIREEENKGKLIPANLGIADMSLTELITQHNTLVLNKMRIQRTATSSNPVIEQLDSQIEVVQAAILTSIQSARNSLNISIRDLEARNRSAQGALSNTPTIEREYVSISRDKALKEQLYLFLYQKREENALTLASTVMPAKVVDTPKQDPEKANNRLTIILFCICLFSLLLPIGGIYLYDLFNTRIEDENAFQTAITIPYAGALVQNHHGGHIAIRDGEKSVSAELFRGLRSNLKFMLPSDIEHPVILVTSAINGEGKSYVASNLAISLALLKKKVVLVGLDIRKPQLAAYFGLSNQGCLTTFLTDSSYTIDDTILPSGQHANLDIIPAGIVPPNPSELILSERLDGLIKELRKRYDYIILDSAPVALVSDTYMLDRLSDMTLFVSRYQYTTKEQINFLNQIVAQKRLKNMASVLNGVKHAKVGYGY